MRILLAIGISFALSGCAVTAPKQSPPEPAQQTIVVTTPPWRALLHIAHFATHGWKDNGLSYEELEARLDRNQRVYVTCGVISELGVRAMSRFNITARKISTGTLQPKNGFDDGHTMIEILEPYDGWEVYDLDMNRQPVDSQGQGITAATFIKQVHRHYKFLAHDKAVDYRNVDPSIAKYYRAMWARGVERWYDRVLGYLGPEATYG